MEKSQRHLYFKKRSNSKTGFGLIMIKWLLKQGSVKSPFQKKTKSPCSSLPNQSTLFFYSHVVPFRGFHISLDSTHLFGVKRNRFQESEWFILPLIRSRYYRGCEEEIPKLNQPSTLRRFAWQSRSFPWQLGGLSSLYSWVAKNQKWTAMKNPPFPSFLGTISFIFRG